VPNAAAATTKMRPQSVAPNRSAKLAMIASMSISGRT
jgi:hypothetical protein